MTKKEKKENSQPGQAQKDVYDFRIFFAELEKLDEGQQVLIKKIVEKIYEAMKECNVMAFASTFASLRISEEVLRSAYHISNLTWKYEK